MSLRYRDSSGVESIVSGLTPGGDIEAGAVAQKHATISIPATNSNNIQIISSLFSDGDMPDTDYFIYIECDNSRYSFKIDLKETTGFRIIARNISSEDISTTTSATVTAIKTYTVQHAAQNAEDIANIKSALPSGIGPSNKLVSTSQFNNTINPITDTVADIEDIIPADASITNKLVSQQTLDDTVEQMDIDIDDALDEDSTNPVQNKVVKAAIDTKQNLLEFDTTPTLGSDNPVTSAGIRAAINAIPSNPVDATTNGDMHAVTSNAAYDADRAIASVVNQLMNALKWKYITGTAISPRTANANLYYNANSVAFMIANPAGTYTCNQAYDNGTTVYYYARLASFSNTDVNTAFPGATNIDVGKLLTVGVAETNKADDNAKVSVYLLRASSSTWYLISTGFRSTTSGQKITTTSAIGYYCQYYHKTSYYSFPSNA